jgi:membrane fusion protein, multidrug efflux system
MDQRVSELENDQDYNSDGKSAGRSIGDSPNGGACKRKPIGVRRILMLIAGLVLLGAAIWYGHYYWTTGRFLVSTDDAYLQADSVIISPKISGYISEVAVQDNQSVKSGQVLARIDDRDYRTALAVAQANVEAEQAAVDSLTRQVDQQSLTVAEARANVDADQARMTFAQQDYQRYLSLSKTGASTIQDAQRATASIRERKAILDHDTAAAGAADQQIGVLDAQLKRAKALLLQQNANLLQAELNVGYATIVAPVDGTIGARTLRVGQYVQAGTQLMAVVPLHAVYVVANYKETQLTNVKAGQKVDIEVDTFPDAVVHGVVDSIAPASGQEFSLLPPDNATGNFTKIVQRVPVKIMIDPKEPLIGRLRPGMSVEPTIKTLDNGS